MVSFPTRPALFLTFAALSGAAGLDAVARPPATPLAQEREVQPRSLCTPDERVVFNCSTGGKLASVCAAHASVGPHAVQYRFGRPGAVEIAVPPRGRDAARHVVLQDARSDSGHAAYLRFDWGGYAYYVYEASERGGVNLITGASTRIDPSGVVVREAGGSTVRRYRCASGPEEFSRIRDPGFPLAVSRPKAEPGADPFEIAMP
jgi:hypothetical protein